MAKKKSTKEKKTNDERILDQHHIEYEEVSFDWINNGADALAEAKEQGVPAESILKTIVMQANNDAKDYVVVCLSLIHEIDLKLVAHELGKKQVHLADNKNLINITGYVHGANTPIGININFDDISVSAGKVGRSVRLKRDDLVSLVSGKYIKVSEN